MGLLVQGAGPQHFPHLAGKLLRVILILRNGKGHKSVWIK